MNYLFMVTWQLMGKHRSQSITSQSGIKVDTLVLLSTTLVKPLWLIKESAQSQGTSLSMLHLSCITTFTELKETERTLEFSNQP